MSVDLSEAIRIAGTSRSAPARHSNITGRHNMRFVTTPASATAPPTAFSRSSDQSLRSPVCAETGTDSSRCRRWQRQQRRHGTAAAHCSRKRTASTRRRVPEPDTVPIGGSSNTDRRIAWACRRAMSPTQASMTCLACVCARQDPVLARPAGGVSTAPICLRVGGVLQILWSRQPARSRRLRAPGRQVRPQIRCGVAVGGVRAESRRGLLYFLRADAVGVLAPPL